MSPKVSVVVPIYNVEKYLKQCVESLLNQTLKGIEIILVDDESPDLSGKIADEYEKNILISKQYIKKWWIRSGKKYRTRACNRRICCIS